MRLLIEKSLVFLFICRAAVEVSLDQTHGNLCRFIPEWYLPDSSYTLCATRVGFFLDALGISDLAGNEMLVSLQQVQSEIAEFESFLAKNQKLFLPALEAEGLIPADTNQESSLGVYSEYLRRLSMNIPEGVFSYALHPWRGGTVDARVDTVLKTVMISNLPDLNERHNRICGILRSRYSLSRSHMFAFIVAGEGNLPRGKWREACKKPLEMVKQLNTRELYWIFRVFLNSRIGPDGAEAELATFAVQLLSGERANEALFSRVQDLPSEVDPWNKQLCIEFGLGHYCRAFLKSWESIAAVFPDDLDERISRLRELGVLEEMHANRGIQVRLGFSADYGLSSPVHSEVVRGVFYLQEKVSDWPVLIRLLKAETRREVEIEVEIILEETVGLFLHQVRRQCFRSFFNSRRCHQHGAYADIDRNTLKEISGMINPRQADAAAASLAEEFLRPGEPEEIQVSHKYKAFLESRIRKFETISDSQCDICYCAYSNERRPVELCQAVGAFEGHFLCEHCAEGLPGVTGNRISCPFCREKIPIKEAPKSMIDLVWEYVNLALIVGVSGLALTVMILFYSIPVLIVTSIRAIL